MAQPYVGEIRMFAGNFAPVGWMLCQGQLLSIAENDTLFNLIGTNYGGDGQTNFALPDLQSRVPIHQGAFAGRSYTLAQTDGTEGVTLQTAQIPSHNHGFAAAPGANSSNPSGNVLADPGASLQIYHAASGLGAIAGLDGAAIQANTPSNSQHNNIQPILGMNFIISLFGIFPSQT